MIADIILVFASLGFVSADLKQVWKLFKNGQHDMQILSKTHFRLKILSLCLTVVAYAMLGVYMALCVAFTQLLLNIWIHNKIGWRHKQGDIR